MKKDENLLKQKTKNLTCVFVFNEWIFETVVAIDLRKSFTINRSRKHTISAHYYFLLNKKIVFF